MTNEQFLQQFGHFIDAPNGLQKLREMVLQLAVQGKLVEQEPHEEPASKLLDRIHAEKTELVTEGKIKNPKALPRISEDEKPYMLPGGWEWVRLGDIGTIGSSSRVHQKDWKNKGIPFYRAREIVLLSKHGIVQNDLYITEEHFDSLSKSGHIPEQDDLMITGVGTIGTAYIVKAEDKFYFKDASVLIFKNYHKIDPMYLLLTFKSPYWQSAIHADSMGTTVHTLTIVRANNSLISLPPLAEQHRIVAKVDELMALCDQLEAEHNAREATHQHLIRAVHHPLTEAADANSTQAAWHRIRDNFTDLYTTLESVQALRQTILQLAVQGKLVKQDSNDEPSSSSLKKAASIKMELIQNKIIKKPKELPDIEESEASFPIPKSWTLIQLQEISSKITDGDHATPRRSTSGNYLLSARNVTNDGILLSPVDYVPDDEFIRMRERCDPNIGDVLISCSGSVGRIALVDRDESYVMVRSAAMVRPIKEAMIPEFLSLSLRSPFLQEQILKRSRKSAQANLFLGAISILVLPTPPLSEQHRIVAKVDELMTLCDQLEANILDKSDTATRYAEAIVQQIAAA